MNEPVMRPSSGTVPAVEARAIHKVFVGGDGSELTVLGGVDLRVESGEAVAIVGSSGAGKSTLLHLLGALDRPTSGGVFLAGLDVSEVDGDALARMRNGCVGFVFQFHHLLREFTALENVMMPCLIAGRQRGAAKERARELLTVVGLEERLSHRPSQLSGGEQQRVAVARALAAEPPLLLADEPSGNLDTQTSEDLHDLLFNLRESQGLGMVLVTHNQELARRADRILELRDGRLHEVARA
ncbi:MAG TPA: ABC transporter ATP-binding protein [Gemmatimonadetes bacterium]|nr:ABC transporter ATP-binding protein [Gemmatimonadota bacterium]